MPIEKSLAQLLIQKQKTLSVAESCSGGLLAHRLTNIPGSSQYFKLGIVAYSDNGKETLLKIPPSVIRNKGTVSKEVVILMAKNILKIAKTDFALGITGIAGPTGATKFKPIGLVYISLATKNRTVCKKYNFKGSRLAIKKQSTDAALNLLKQYLE